MIKNIKYEYPDMIITDENNSKVKIMLFDLLDGANCGDDRICEDIIKGISVCNVSTGIDILDSILKSQLSKQNESMVLWLNGKRKKFKISKQHVELMESLGKNYWEKIIPLEMLVDYGVSKHNSMLFCKMNVTLRYSPRDITGDVWAQKEYHEDSNLLINVKSTLISIYKIGDEKVSEIAERICDLIPEEEVDNYPNNMFCKALVFAVTNPDIVKETNMLYTER